MKKILAFGASNSKTSINKAFATYVAHQIENLKVIVADLNDYALTLYSIDLEKEKGVHENALRLKKTLGMKTRKSLSAVLFFLGAMISSTAQTDTKLDSLALELQNPVA
ncbi:MAG: NAD(P)H-dependent oxidoreductase, partial [Bacteroidota bacterium]